MRVAWQEVTATEVRLVHPGTEPLPPVAKSRSHEAKMQLPALPGVQVMFKYGKSCTAVTDVMIGVVAGPTPPAADTKIVPFMAGSLGEA